MTKVSLCTQGAALIALLAGSLAAGLSGPAWCADLAGRPDDYLQLVKRLKPGDRLLLEPGIYTDGLKLHGIEGQRNAPIVIEGPAKGRRAVFLGREGANTVSIANASFILIRNLELDGRNLPVDAVKAEGTAAWAHHITLEGLRIINHGDEQGTVAISTKCPAWGWTIRGNEIIGAGTGMYLGGSDGSAPFVSGVIEDNVVRDTIGYNLQVKHQTRRPSLPGLPITPERTIIRGNLFIKSSNSSVGGFARPNVLVGHFPVTGPGSEDLYEIRENIFFGNPTEALLQGEGRFVVQRNVFLNPAGNAMAVRPHNDILRRVGIRDNFIAARDSPLTIEGVPAGAVLEVRDNVIYQISAESGAAIAGEGPPSSTKPPQVLQGWLEALADVADHSEPDALARALRRVCPLDPSLSAAPNGGTRRQEPAFPCHWFRAPALQTPSDATRRR